jgi:hypothetical protein
MRGMKAKAPTDRPSFASLNNLRMYARKCMRSFTIHGVEPISIDLQCYLCGQPMLVGCHRDGTVTYLGKG